MKDRFNAFREKANIVLYNSKDRVLRIFRLLSILVSLFALGIVTYYFGYPLNENEDRQIFNLIECSFGFYILHFLVRYIYDFHPKQFLRNNLVEAVIIGTLLIEGASNIIYGNFLLKSLFTYLGVNSFSDISTAFVLVYLLSAALTDLFRSSSNFNKKSIKLHPSFIFISIFILLISVGTGILMLPEMTSDGRGMDFLNALFTSTSATCVTGLIVEDTATFFTFKGQFIIMLLIKLGGLNIIAFASFMSLFSKFGFGVKHHEIIEDFVNKESMLSSKGMFGKIVSVTLAIEFIGALVIFFSWGPGVEFATLGDQIFHSTFHSISAFNNAGFSTFTNGVANTLLENQFILHVALIILVFFGGLGLPTIIELFNVNQLRNRLKYPWKKLSVSSRINLYMGLALSIGGAVLIFFLEYDYLLAKYNSMEKAITALFSSVTTRTAGFNTVDFGDFGYPALLLIMFLMFVGASSSSTSGGIKTSTLFVVIASNIATITGRKHIEFSKRTIPAETVSKAYAIVLYAIGLILLSTFLLSISEANLLKSNEFSLIDLFFEELSAFSTVGLSLGVTPLLSIGGKTIIIISMFVGRIGTLTFAFLIGRNLAALKYQYPEENIPVG